MQRDAAAIVDMLEFARKILAFTKGLDERAFAGDPMAQAAVLYQLTIIGEAVRRMSQPTRLAFPHVPWLRISNMRNVLIHDYDDVNLTRIWMVVTQDIPALVALLAPIVRALDGKRSDADPE